MKRALLILLVLLLVSRTESSSCRSHCGAIELHFPFGVGKGCYLNEYYEVKCRARSVPFLHKFNKEIVSLDLPRPFQDADEFVPFGTIRIKTHILTSVGCSGGHGNEFQEVLNFSGTPYSIGDNHTLVAFGCNNKATTKHIEPRLVGCVSSCEPDILRKIPGEEQRKRCDGYKCCNVQIAGDVGQVFGVTIEGIDGGNSTTTGGKCRVAFLTDEYIQVSPWNNIKDPKWFYARQFSTIELTWHVQTTNLSFKASLLCRLDPRHEEPGSNPCYCNGFTVNKELSYLWCACTAGYEGNPYVLDGCKDIDECAVAEKDGRPKCINGDTCQNVPGSYRCVIDKDKTLPIYIGVGVGLGVLLVGVGIWIYKAIKKQRKINQRKRFFHRNGGLLLQEQLTSVEGSVEKTTVFSSKELKKATENFSVDRVVGQGGQGTVFKGMLPDGTIVAVKKAKLVDQENLAEFINELVIVSKINHRSIVKMLGCCLETEVPILVYEFLPNGNLFQHLQKQLEDSIETTWEARLRISIEVAGALSYLHSAASSPVYHRDIKSTNIMLDEKNKAKLADFGTSRVIEVDRTHLTTVFAGTAGYMDHEYFQSGKYTDKSDVYGFGVVLAELVTGEKPVFFQPSQGNKLLSTHFLDAMKQDRLLDIIDPRIRDQCNVGEVTAMARIAKMCLKLKREKRPSMKEVSMELERISSSHAQVSAIGYDEDEDEDEDEEVAPLYNRRSQSLNICMASTSGSQDDYDRLVRSETEPLFPRLSS